jgi:VIT1/CCC1 family predicted Fe2+/Mn2+ transporter
MPFPMQEHHRSSRVNWLRAAVLGANDGIVSTASLVVGVASAHSQPREILLAGAAGLVAGAMSMAAGEYVSVSSQSDTEKADLDMEKKELERNSEAETNELAMIYVQRGLDSVLAQKVAEQLMAHDALGAHARDELGISETIVARPLQAALASAATFALGAGLPLSMAFFVKGPQLVPLTIAASLFSLAALGALAARTGGANAWKGSLRVTFWGALAMGLTAGIGALFGTPPAG